MITNDELVMESRVKAVKCAVLAVPFAALGIGFSMLVGPSERDGLAAFATVCAACTGACAAFLACLAMTYALAGGRRRR